jgi:hypothetical protein
MDDVSEPVNKSKSKVDFKININGLNSMGRLSCEINAGGGLDLLSLRI